MKVKYIYQQVISHMSVIIVAFLLLSLMFAHYVETLVYTNKTEELLSYADDILRDLDNGEDIRRIISQFNYVLKSRNTSVNVFDPDGTLYYTGGKQGPDVELSEQEWSKIKDGKTVIVKQDFERFEQDVSFVLKPYVQNGHFLGGILLTSPISGSREMVSQINKFLFYAILVSVGASFLMSWVLSKVHVNRIRKLREATSLVSAGDYTVKVPSSDFDEIGELAEDFNKMVEKINASMEEIEALENRRRQFMSDVSHEMRTPLTTISGILDGLKNNMIPDEDKEKGLNLVTQEARRLIRLVNENLDYDKIRSNQVYLFSEEIEVLEILEIVKEQLFQQAEQKSNEILIDADENLVVNADYDRLLQILINITKNSIQFTEEGKIWLRGKAGYKETIIEIEDTGIGMDPEEVENIWRRFYKADLSRTSNPFGEFGLGLAIVKQLVQLHKGDIQVFSKKGEGTKFTIRLPIV